MVLWRHARLVGQRAPGVVGPGTRSRWAAEVIRATDLRQAKEA